jgi:hypothetical protein
VLEGEGGDLSSTELVVDDDNATVRVSAPDPSLSEGAGEGGEVERMSLQWSNGAHA